VLVRAANAIRLAIAAEIRVVVFIVTSSIWWNTESVAEY
jgi:hypothetical protein